MAFLDNIKKIAKDTADKAGDMMEVNKLNSRINTLNNIVNENKLKIGNYYFQQLLIDNNPPSDIADFFAAINTSLEEIASVQAEIQTIKSKEAAAQNAQPAQPAAGIVCSSCGAANPEGSRFCKGCGGKIEAPHGITCGNCGSVNAADTKFCKDCGTPVVAPAPAPVQTSCPSCGAELTPGTKFCASCGTKVGA